MHPPRLIGGFFLRLLVVYALLAAPWPFVETTYGAVYRTVANWLFGTYGNHGLVEFSKASLPDGSLDSVISIRSRSSAVSGRTAHSSRLTGYLPTVELLALILATPLPWSRRWKSLLAGLFIAQLFIWLRLHIVMLHFFDSEGPWKLYRFTPFWSGLLERTFEIAVVSPSLSFIMPVFIWIGVTFRREDLATFTSDQFDSRTIENHGASSQ